MSAATYTLTGNAHDLIGDGPTAKLRGSVVPVGVDVINDVSANEQRYGGYPLNIDSTGLWTITLIGTGALVPAYVVVIEYVDGTSGSKVQTVRSNAFAITSNTTFAAVLNLPPVNVDLTTLDSYIAQRITNPASATAIALSATYGRLVGVATPLTANGPLTAGKNNPVDASAASGNRAMTLADATGEGQMTVVQKTDSSANTVTVTVAHLRDSGASGTVVLYGQYEARVLVSKADGSWWPIADHRSKTYLDATYAVRSNQNISGAGRQLEYYSGGSDAILHTSSLTGFSGPYLEGIGVDRAGSYAGKLISIKRQATGLQIDQWGDGGVGVQRSSHGSTVIENTDLYAGSLGVQYALKSGQSYTDGVANGTTTFTSATAAFVAGDVGKTITSDQPNPNTIPAGTTIVAVNSATSVTMSAAATESLSPVVFTVGSRANATTQRLLTMYDTDSTTVLFRFRKGDWTASVPLIGKDAASTVLRVQATTSQSADLQSWRDPNTNIYTRVTKTGYLATRVTSAPVDADIANGEGQFYIDATAGAPALKIRMKDSAGTAFTRTVSS